MLCNMCPRKCNVNRTEKLGFCQENDCIRIAKIIPSFMLEEPCITGEKGALAIFFSGCNLRCEFCQNYEISRGGKGQTYSEKQFIELLSSYKLDNFSCIDLISPSQFSVQIASALSKLEINIPIVWNSNGYESESTIAHVSKYVDIFLVDLKFYDSDISYTLAGAKDYFKVASKTLKLMCNLKTNSFSNGFMKRGVIIRHLILPGHSKDSLKLIDFIADNIKNPFVSIMSQFTPIEKSQLARKITPLEYKLVTRHALKRGINQGYFQAAESANKDYIPKF